MRSQAESPGYQVPPTPLHPPPCSLKNVIYWGTPQLLSSPNSLPYLNHAPSFSSLQIHVYIIIYIFFCWGLGFVPAQTPTSLSAVCVCDNAGGGGLCLELKGCIGAPNLFVLYEPPDLSERDRRCQAEKSHGARVRMAGYTELEERERWRTSYPPPSLGQKSGGSLAGPVCLLSFRGCAMVTWMRGQKLTLWSVNIEPAGRKASALHWAPKCTPLAVRLTNN